MRCLSAMLMMRPLPAMLTMRPLLAMPLMQLLTRTLALAVIMLSPGQPARAQTPSDADPCSGYKWDVTAERALFATSPKPIAAGKDRTSAGSVAANQLFTVTLHPLSEVSFPTPPGRTPPSGSFAGIVALTVPAPGKYRISADVPLWIDVAGGAILAPVLDYEGLHDCSAPRKVVVFDLQGGTNWAIDVSAADREAVRLAITPVR